MALSVIVFWFSLLILHQFFSNHWIEFIMLHYKTEHWLNFDFFSGNSTMAFFNKSLRPVEQYWNAMMHWKNIWFAFIKFLLLLSKKVRIFLGYICFMYCHFVLDLPPPPSAHCYLTGLFVLLSVLGVLRPSVMVRMFFPCVSMNCLIGVTFVFGSLQWNLPLIIILCDCSLKEYCV